MSIDRHKSSGIPVRVGMSTPEEQQDDQDEGGGNGRTDTMRTMNALTATVLLVFETLPSSSHKPTAAKVINRIVLVATDSSTN